MGRRSLCLMTAFFTLVGCRSAVVMPIPTPTVEATQTKVPLRVPEGATPNLASPEVFSALPFREFERWCVEVSASLPDGFLSEGIIYFYRSTNVAEGDLLTLTSGGELKVLRRYEYPHDQGVWISPDGRWLAYGKEQVGGGITLEIISYDGTKRFSHAWDRRWSHIQAWLPLDRIVFALWGKELAVDILHIRTGEVETVKSFVTDRYMLGRDVEGQYTWRIVPDSTLERIVYWRDRGEFPPRLVLLDLETGVTLWEVARFTPGDSEYPPVWSPDGSQMAVVADDYHEDGRYHLEVFTVNLDGRAVQWLDVPTEDRILIEPEAKWSPNGRYLALCKVDSLYIIDTFLRRALDLCISYPEQVIWSPDSKQIVVAPGSFVVWSKDGEQIVNPEGVPPLVIDLERQKAVLLVNDKNIRPIGWLKSP